MVHLYIWQTTPTCYFSLVFCILQMTYLSFLVLVLQCVWAHVAHAFSDVLLYILKLINYNYHFSENLQLELELGLHFYVK